MGGGNVTMMREEIFADSFPIYVNGKMYKLDWLQKPKLQCLSQVDVGIDQSSTSSGLTIQGDDLTFITELPRGHMTVYEYKKALGRQLQYLLGGLSVKHFIYEKHGRHITPLHSLINEITDEIKAFTKPLIYNDVIVKGVLPTVWRSGFLKGEEYKGRFRREDVKLACVDEVIKRDPLTAVFKEHSHKKNGVPDYDGYESYGIINGYLELNYNSIGQRIVNTTMEKRADRRFNHLIFKTTEMDEARTLKHIQRNYTNLMCPVLIGNNDLLINEMMNRVQDDYDECIIKINEHPELSRIILELKEEHIPGDRYLIYTKKK